MTRLRWIVAVDGEVRYTTDTEHRDEAQIWVDEHLDPDTDYEIMSTTPEAEDILLY